MPEEPSEFPHLRRLKEAAVKFRQGWAKDNPISEKHLEAVRETIRQEWTKEQAERKTESKTKAQKQSSQKSIEQKKSTEKTDKTENSQSKSKGQSH